MEHSSVHRNNLFKRETLRTTARAGTDYVISAGVGTLDVDNPSPCEDHIVDRRLKSSVNAVNWDVLSATACKIYNVKSATWGQQFNGGYNVVRFMKLDDREETEIVARVPYVPEDGMTDERALALGSRIASEVASMEYVTEHTRIPVPRVIAHNITKDGNGVGSPYILMTKVEGAPLSSVWNDMDDDKREVILRQVIDILLQLSSVRFDSIGALFKGDGVTKPVWYLEPLLTVLDVDDSSVARTVSKRLYNNALDYWTAYANTNLENIEKENFGSIHKSYDYVMAWFLRSLIPSLFNTSLDTKGFPLSLGDFHSQNIMVTDMNTASPKITGIIDWEFTVTDATSSFAQFPLFIVDHPAWEDDHPLKPRNIQDQATFLRLIREAESKRDPEGSLPLTRTYEGCRGVYLFQQCLTDQIMFSALYEQLFEHVFGEQVKEEYFSVSYYQALMNGILKKQMDQFKEEATVKEQAVEALGNEIVTSDLTRSQFKNIILENCNKFNPEGDVMKWLLGHNFGTSC